MEQASGPASILASFLDTRPTMTEQDRYASPRAVLGPELFDKLVNSRVLVVGCVALISSHFTPSRQLAAADAFGNR